MQIEVAIVGGGPIGLFIGAQLSKRGFEVQIFEEHSDIGNPSHCSGLFSYHIFDIVGKIGILHPAKTATIHAPNGETLKIGNKKIRGYVVDRVRFDRSLAKIAVNNGVTINLKERVKKISYQYLKTNKREYKSKIIIGADGINSIVRRSLSIKSPKILSAAQIISTYPVENLENVDIFVGSSIAPGFFGWIIPLFDNLVKIGVGSYKNAWTYLKKLLKKLNAQPLSITGGGIPINTVDRSFDKGIILVGDAAGQVKATSGGGVYPGLMASKCAIEIVSSSLEEENYSFQKLREYETCWKKGIGKELRNASYLHKIYRKINDEEFNEIIKTLNDKKIIKIINEEGDIDYPSKVVFKVLRKKPSLMKFLSIPVRPYHK